MTNPIKALRPTIRSARGGAIEASAVEPSGDLAAELLEESEALIPKDPKPTIPPHQKSYYDAFNLRQQWVNDWMDLNPTIKKEYKTAVEGGFREEVKVQESKGLDLQYGTYGMPISPPGGEIVTVTKKGGFVSDVIKNGIIEAIRQSELESGRDDINQFVIVPERYELVEDPSVSSALSWHSQHLSSSKSGRKRPVKIPAVMGTLYDPKVELFYQAMEKGLLGDIWGREFDSKGKPNPNYIPEDLMIAYGALVRERNPGDLYSKHKYYKALKQRSWESLSSLGIDPTTEQWNEFIASAIPFREDFVETFGSEKELEYRGRVETLMGIYEKDYDLARVAGKITGLLGGGIGLYKMLAQKGMTSLIGVGKAKGFRNLGYTGLAEIGLDWAYNKDGATFILAGLMDAEPNRILSGIEAFTIGTSLNLGIDFAALIKGKTQRKAMLMAADKLNIERSKLLSALEKRGDKKFVEDVEAVLREEPIDIDLPGNIKLGPLAPADAAVIKDVAITASADAWARIDLLRGDIKNLESHFGKGGTAKDKPKRLANIAKKQKEIDAIHRDLGIHNLEDEMRARQLAKEKIAENKGISSNEMEKRIGSAFPEKPATNLDEWMKRADEVTPGWDDGTSAMSTREAVRRGSLHTIGLSVLGGGLGMTLDDDNEWGGFYAGAMLPIAPGISKSIPRLRDKTARKWGDLKKGIPRFIKQRYYGATEIVDTTQDYLGYRLTPWISKVRRAGGHNIAMLFRQHRMRVMAKQYERAKRGIVFFDHMRGLVDDGILSQAAKDKIYRALLEGDQDAALRGIRQIDKHPDYPAVERSSEHRITTEPIVPQVSATEMYFNEARKVLVEMGEEGVEKGALSGLYDGYYWPRNIKPAHYKEFLRDINKLNDSRIENAWSLAKSKHGGRDLSDHEKVTIANDVIVNYGFIEKGVGVTAHNKRRVYQGKIDDLIYKYYDNLEESYFNYIGSMTEKTELSGLLGRHAGLTKDDLIAAVEERGGVPPQFLGTGGKVESDVTIGEVLTKAFKNDNLTQAQKAKIEKLIYQRYVMPTGDPAGYINQTIRRWSYELTLINPYSTITNMTDVLLTASLGNREMLGGSVFEEMANMAASLRKGRKLTYTLEDFGIDTKDLDSVMAELSDEKAAGRFLKWGLRRTGFRLADVFGKTALINSAYREMRKAALAGKGSKRYSTLADEYKKAYAPDEWESFIKALADDNSKHPLVKSAVLDRLLNQHPVSLDDVPLGYSKHPKARVYYALNTFFLKQFDLVRTRIIDDITDGVKMGGKAGLKKAGRGVLNLVKYAGIFGVGTMGADALKDWMLGREVNISDRAMHSALKLIGLSRYSLFRMERMTTSGSVGEYAKFFGTMLAPASAKIVIDDIIPSSAKLATGETQMKDTAAFRKLSIGGIPMPDELKDILPAPSSRIWKYIPFIGRDVYWTIGHGADVETQRKLKKIKKLESGMTIRSAGHDLDYRNVPLK